jgi:nitrogen regulatory protein PII
VISCISNPDLDWYAIKPLFISNLLEEWIETANMKKIEIIVPHGVLPAIHNVLIDLNVGGMTHYEIEGSGRVKEDPVVAATHPSESRYQPTAPEYIDRTKIEVVIKNEQVEDLISNLRDKIRGAQGGKIFIQDVLDAVDIPTYKRGEQVI